MLGDVLGGTLARGFGEQWGVVLGGLFDGTLNRVLGEARHRQKI